MTIRRLFSLLTMLLALLPAALAQQAAQDTLRVSLLTCYPGTDVYELCGHTALRIKTPKTDSVWNYGVFDFDAPNFIYRFCKGETDYMLATRDTERFLMPYLYGGRRVVEQVLDLSPAEAEQLRANLRTEALPQNRTYRYNYVKDNCATRPLQRIEQVVDQPLLFSEPVRYGTFRDEMRHFHRDYPWYQFGIDLALGSGLDYQLAPREETFVPMVLMQHLSTAVRAESRQPLVSRTILLYPGTDKATLPPTPWLLTPLAVSLYLLAICLAFCIWSIRRRRVVRWVYALWFLLTGVAGCVIAFLVFVSTHEATSPNLVIWWLNPLGLLVPGCIWSRRTRPLVTVVMWFVAVVVGTLMVAWAFLPQSANPAFFPLMGCSLLLAATYLYLKK